MDMIDPKKGKRRQSYKRWLPFAVTFIFLIAGVGAILRGYQSVERMQNAVSDAYQRLKPRPYEEAPVRILDIYDESLNRLGQMPWPRTLFADVVSKLAKMGA